MSGVALGFWAQAQRDPSFVAAIDPQGLPVQAGALLAASNQLAHGLRRLGLARGAVLAVSTKNRVELLELYFAAAQIGLYFTPINIRLTAPELGYLLADSEAAAFVFDGETAARTEAAVRAHGARREICIALDRAVGFRPFEALKEGMPSAPPTDRSAGEKMYYTSGTTGRPNAVRRPLPADVPERAGAAALAHLGAVAGFEPADGTVHLAASPLYHSGALLWCTDHLHLGHRVVLMDQWTPEGMLERVDRHGVTASFMVPTHFRRLLALPDEARARYRLSSLRRVVHAAAPCPVEVKRQMLAWWGPVIYEVYGSAEGGGTCVGPTEWLENPGTVGRDGSLTLVRVLRDDGTECAAGEVGTVFLKHLAAPFEYWKDPAKTAAARRGELFTVGDVGYLDAHGYLFLCDRKSDVIISGGVNIYPAEVEAVLTAHPRVGDAAVFGVPDADLGERVKALVEPRTGVEAGPALARELLEHLRERLAPFKCPRAIDFVTSLPRDPSGKLYKRALRDPYWEGAGKSI